MIWTLNLLWSLNPYRHRIIFPIIIAYTHPIILFSTSPIQYDWIDYLISPTSHLITQISQFLCDNHSWPKKDPTSFNKDNQSTISEVIQSIHFPILQNQKSLADLKAERSEKERRQKSGTQSNWQKDQQRTDPKTDPFTMAASWQMKFSRVQPTKRMEIQLTILLPFCCPTGVSLIRIDCGHASVALNGQRLPKCQHI